MLTRRHLLLLAAVATCAALFFAHRQSLRLLPAHSALPAHATGSFTEGGWHPGDALAHVTPQLRAWGSWSGNDALTGTLTLGPFPAPRILRFALGGYPTNTGNALHVERVDTGERRPIEFYPVGERWFICDHLLPPAWEGRSIRLIATDNSTILGGWLALTEPLRGGRGDGNNALLETLTAWALNGLLLALPFFAAARLLNLKLQTPNGQLDLPRPWLPLVAAALVAACGYVVFWSYLAHPWLGQSVTAILFLTSAILLLRNPKPETQNPAPSPDLPLALTLTVTVGAFYLTILHLFPTGHDFYTLAGNRFRENLPGDNYLSHIYAERLFAGRPIAEPVDEWQPSDRPPLQLGWQLLTWPVAKLLQFDRKTFSGTAAFWLQLLWVPALYGLLRSFQLTPRRAAAWTAACALSGFFLQNTTFTWPKLSAAAFALGAYALLFLPAQVSNLKFRLPSAALLAALAWLSHGGVAFSFLALLPWVAARFLRPYQISNFKSLLPAATVFLALALPWIAYQKFAAPPANTLLKLHFAGVQQRDAQGLLSTMSDAYAKIGWRTALENKVANFHGQVFGDWSHLFDLSAAGKTARRDQEFFHLGRALTWWPVLLPFALALTARRLLPARLPVSPSPHLPFSPSSPLLTPDLLHLLAWQAATIVVWCLLMFGAYTAAIHQGSYVVPLACFALCSVILDRAGRGWLLLLVAFQGVTLTTTWIVSNAIIQGPPAGLPFVLLTATALAAFIILAPSPTQNPQPQPQNPPRPTQLPTPNPKLQTFALCAVAAALCAALFLRKPHALHTPQLWAEDGSIFLTQNDLHGPTALALPYMGYLHTLPRLIAFATSHLADPAWWPHLYNYTAFAIWLAVILRLFTARFAHLPGRPWLALAMIAVPHTGEVFFNVTNLQWITAFVLIQQAVIADPTRLRQRVSDLAILAAVALTGPFGVAFLPLFALRWLLSPSPHPPVSASHLRFLFSSAPPARDRLLAFATVALCAALQLWFVITTGPRFDYQSATFQLWPTLVVLARRILLWPLLGHDLALSLSPTLLGIIGLVALSALLAWTLRAHPQRPLRLQIVAAFVLITLAAVYRTRPDTWAADNLNYGDRYFYIPRVLLFWLVIWEFHARPRAVASLARTVCVLVALVHLKNFVLPAPKDYRWRDHVEPIRRGVPANIPTLPENWTLEYLGRPK